MAKANSESFSKSLEKPKGSHESSTRLIALRSQGPFLHQEDDGLQMEIQSDSITIKSFNALHQESKKAIERVLRETGLGSTLEIGSFDSLRLPRQVNLNGKEYDIASMLGYIIDSDTRKSLVSREQKHYPHEIDFNEVNKKAIEAASHIRANYQQLVAILTQYETHEVAEDEIRRSLDLLENLGENKAYFKRRIGSVGSYLPLNQPLYAFTCFSMVPALMSEAVYARPPVASREVFDQLKSALNTSSIFPNITVSNQNRADFNGMCRDEGVEVVIFTGKMENAYKIQRYFGNDVLLIVNGAGHNPIIVSEDADIEAAVHTSIESQLYNQGQDCAGPSAILIHSKVQKEFMERLRMAVKDVIVGPYSDPNTRVGPISSLKDLPRISGIIDGNRDFIDPSTPGDIDSKSGLVNPVIINKPLKEGGNYEEQFAPVFFVHDYESDDELDEYFENEQYSRNAMYVTLFGNSPCVEDLTNRHFSDGRPLHGQEQIIRNQGLHAPGIERGTQPYGGYGRRASCLILDGRIMPQPTLPQRDIFEHLVRPVTSLQTAMYGKFFYGNAKSTKSAPEKTHEIKAPESHEVKEIPSVLESKNTDYLQSSMDETGLNKVRLFVSQIRNSDVEADEILNLAYEVAKSGSSSKKEGKRAIKPFFKDIYNLLIGADSGPRIPTLIQEIGREKAIELLDV